MIYRCYFILYKINTVNAVPGGLTIARLVASVLYSVFVGCPLLTLWLRYIDGLIKA